MKQLAEAGIEAHEGDVKRFMAYFQMKRFEAITETELDEDLLKQVAGDTVYCSYVETTECSNVFDHNAECDVCEARHHCASGCRAQAICDHELDYLGLDERTCKICKEN